jgi:flagellar biosynthesis/type III secretory pathway protein FliH
MSEMLTIRLPQRIAGASLSGTPLEEVCAGAGQPIAPTAGRDVPSETQALREIGQQKAHLDQLCQAVNSIAGGLSRLHQETLAHNRTEIARLAVEIARKILRCKVDKGEYDMQGIVEEALKLAPTQQNIVIRVNPDDVPLCQQLQRENPAGPFTELEFTPDWSIGRGECLVETPKGIVKSFLEEHLEHIAEALQKVE